MAINGYLAMTAAEFRENPPQNDKMAWMACHFSPYGTGLSNCPEALPAESMLILNDRTPISGHDHRRILNRLCELVDTLKCGAVLLDFQRAGMPELSELSGLLMERLPCPAAVSDLYAEGSTCPVFLPPVPPDIPLDAYLAPWKDREIWLEAALNACCISLSESGAAVTPLLQAEAAAEDHRDEELCCHYRIEAGEELHFTLYRTREDLRALLAQAEMLGVTRTVGLYQELGELPL